MEFSKKLTIALIMFGACGVIASYILAFLGKNANDVVTVTMITQIMATAIGYLLYQYKLKDSRNKNKVDENGIPFEQNKSKIYEKNFSSSSQLL